MARAKMPCRSALPTAVHPASENGCRSLKLQGKSNAVISLGLGAKTYLQLNEKQPLAVLGPEFERKGCFKYCLREDKVLRC